MPKTKNNDLNDFGSKLAKLRKNSGYTQVQLANEIGVSRRVIGYYESETKHPPTVILAPLAEALGTSVNELLNNQATEKKQPLSSGLERRLRKIEAMDGKEKKQVLQILDAFIEKEQLKQQVQTMLSTNSHHP